MPTLRASFSVDIDRLKSFGVLDQRSVHAQDIFKSGKLTSDERLYLSLCGSTQLSSVTFGPKQKIISAGQTHQQAYIIVSGTLIGTQGDDIYRFGPGSVLGLAEGVINQPSKYSVITTSAVQRRHRGQAATGGAFDHADGHQAHLGAALGSKGHPRE